MKIIEKKLCVFTHFGKYENIPEYVNIYINELSKYFDQIILVTNERPINIEYKFTHPNVSVIFVKNEGYDLGMFYKVFQSIDQNEYHQIACINDSNILFNHLNNVFEWSKNQNVDFWGLIDSYQKPWFSTHQNNYHIQSHFLVFHRKAIDKLPLFFKSIQIEKIFEEKDQLKLRRMVINEWEIGLTQFLMGQGLTCGSFINSQSFSQLHLGGKITNVGHKLYAELIYAGYPLLKRKVITKHHWKDIFRSHQPWEKLIRKYGNQEWEIEALTQELIKMSKES